jgi:hypothetical protein
LWRREVLTTVNLKNETKVVTDEIENVAAERHLAPETEPL